MVFLRLLNFRGGMRPSQAILFNYKNLTPTQKLELARCRIFGTLLDSGYTQGINKWKKKNSIFNIHEQLRDKLQFDHVNREKNFPIINTRRRVQMKNQLFQDRKMRIMMKGIKVGVKKGGKKVNIAGIMSKLNQQHSLLFLNSYNQNCSKSTVSGINSTLSFKIYKISFQFFAETVFTIFLQFKNFLFNFN